MPQILCIKTTNTPYKAVGDIVGVYEDTHKFSAREMENYTIHQIKGFTTALELKKAMPYAPIKRAYRTPVANVWSFDMPEEAEFWQDVDKKWYKYNEKVKFKLNIDTLTQQDLENLEGGLLSSTETATILGKMHNRIKDKVENLVEEPQLGVEIIG